jgi:hypothetical protein
MSDPRFQDPLIDPRRPSVRDPHAQRFRPAGVRVCPETSRGIAKFSEHEAD